MALVLPSSLHDPAEAYKAITELMGICHWESSPPLSIDLLASLKLKIQYEDIQFGSGTEAERESRLNYFMTKTGFAPADFPEEIVISDTDGNRAFLRYGDMDDLHNGFRFDADHDWDEQSFPLLQKAIELLHGDLKAHDGGSTDPYDEWLGIPANNNQKQMKRELRQEQKRGWWSRLLHGGDS
jgi:hypothetical protein